MRWVHFVGHVGTVRLTLLKSSHFKTDLKSYNENRDSNTLNALITVVRTLGNQQQLPEIYDDHSLHGKVKGLDDVTNARDCHPQGDRVLIYEIVDGALILYRFGKHSEVFERHVIDTFRKRNEIKQSMMRF